jgi:hypothetical protein
MPNYPIIGFVAKASDSWKLTLRCVTVHAHAKPWACTLAKCG